MNTASRPTRLVTAILAGLVLALPSPAAAQKVFLNPSNQTGNPVGGGGNEADYALLNAQIAAAILEQAGFQVVVDQDFTNAPANANSWGADIFVSIHSNAGGGHGTETLYKTTNGQALATRIQAGMLSRLPYGDRGLVQRDNLWVLNQTAMVAALAEAVFHDCVAEAGFLGHPPSESSFLRSAEGQTAIGGGIAAGVCAWFGGDCAPVAPLTGILKGVVYREPDLADRIAGATVSLQDGTTTVASATGYWEFELEPGTYTVTASAEGYEPASTTRTVGAGDEVWGSIGLVPATAMSDPDTGTPPADEGIAVAEDVSVTTPDAVEPPEDVPDAVARTDEGTHPSGDPGPAADIAPGDVQDVADPATADDTPGPRDTAAADPHRDPDGGTGQDAGSEKPLIVLDASAPADSMPPQAAGGCRAGGTGLAGPFPLLPWVLVALWAARGRRGGPAAPRNGASRRRS